MVPPHEPKPSHKETSCGYQGLLWPNLWNQYMQKAQRINIIHHLLEETLWNNLQPHDQQ